MSIDFFPIVNDRLPNVQLTTAHVGLGLFSPLLLNAYLNWENSVKAHWSTSQFYKLRSSIYLTHASNTEYMTSQWHQSAKWPNICFAEDFIICGLRRWRLYLFFTPTRSLISCCFIMVCRCKCCTHVPHWNLYLLNSKFYYVYFCI